MLIHYRHEGKSHRTLCGQRFVPGHRPRLLQRDWQVLPPARDCTPEEVDNRQHRFPCSACLGAAAASIAAAQARSSSGSGRAKAHAAWADLETDG